MLILPLIFSLLFAFYYYFIDAIIDAAILFFQATIRRRCFRRQKMALMLRCCRHAAAMLSQYMLCHMPYYCR